MPSANRPPPVTLGDFFRLAVRRFRAARLAYGHGTTNAVDEAAFMMLEALHLPIHTIEPWLDRVPALVRAAPAIASGRWVLTDDTGSLPLDDASPSVMSGLPRSLTARVCPGGGRSHPCGLDRLEPTIRGWRSRPTPRHRPRPG